MAGNLPNLHWPGTLPDLSPQVERTVHDLFDRVNYLTTELDRVRKGIPDLLSPKADRVSPNPGRVTIPGVQGNGFIRVNQDGLVDSFVGPLGDLAGVPFNIRVDFSIVNSAGAGPDILHTFTLQPGSLKNDGDFLDVWYGGSTTANANNKFVRATFGGTAYETMGAFTIPGAIGWAIDARIIRTSATSVRVSHKMIINAVAGDGAAPPAMTTFAAGGLVISRNTPITGLPTLNNNPVVMTAQGGGVAAADVFQNLSIINLTRLNPG